MCYDIDCIGYNSKDNRKMKITIKNQSKILGESLYSKFLPQVGEWRVVSILKDEFAYDIKIENVSTLKWERIYLDRKPHYDPADFEPKYKLWGLDKDYSKEKSKFIAKEQIEDMDRFCLNMVMLLKKMLVGGI